MKKTGIKWLDVYCTVLFILSCSQFVIVPLSAAYLGLKWWATALIIIVMATMSYLITGIGYYISTIIIMPIALIITLQTEGIRKTVFYIFFVIWLTELLLRIGYFIILTVMGDEKPNSLDILRTNKSGDVSEENAILKKHRATLKKIGLSFLVFLGYGLLNTLVFTPLFHAMSSSSSGTAEAALGISSIAGLVSMIGFYFVVWRGLRRIWKKTEPKEDEEEVPPIPTPIETTDYHASIDEHPQTAQGITPAQLEQEELIETAQFQNIVETGPATKEQVSITLPSFIKKSRLSTVVLSLLLGASVTAVVLCAITISNLHKEVKYQDVRISGLDAEVIKLRRDLTEKTQEAFSTKTNIAVYEAYICCITEGDSYYHVFDKCTQLKKGILKGGGFTLLNVIIAEQTLGLKPCPYCH